MNAPDFPQRSFPPPRSDETSFFLSPVSIRLTNGEKLLFPKQEEKTAQKSRPRRFKSSIGISTLFCLFSLESRIKIKARPREFLRVIFLSSANCTHYPSNIFPDRGKCSLLVLPPFQTQKHPPKKKTIARPLQRRLGFCRPYDDPSLIPDDLLR